MCDYSLMAFPNRLAVEGEHLVAYRFPSSSMGLASPADVQASTQAKTARRPFWTAVKQFFSAVESCPVPAVCIPPGARLRLTEIGDDFRKKYAINSEEEVTFEQLTSAVNTYRDAISFRTGLKVRLQDLPEGQRVTVLNLAGSETHTPPVFSEVLLRR